jgi:hypothetical protein
MFRQPMAVWNRDHGRFLGADWFLDHACQSREYFLVHVSIVGTGWFEPMAGMR